MSGRHDKSGDDDLPARLLVTGPIVIKGLSRGVRDRLAPRESRHRAAADAPPMAVGPAEAENGEALVRADPGGSGPSAPWVMEPQQDGYFRQGGGGAVADEPDRGPSSGEGPTGADQAAADDPAAPRDAGSGRVTAADRDGAAEPVPPRPARPARPAGPLLRDRLGPEAVGIAVLVVLALICAGLIVAVVRKTQVDAEIAAREAAAYTPPPLPSVVPTVAGTGPLVAFVGDGSVTQADSPVEEAARWPAVLADDVSARFLPLAADGDGYVTPGADGSTFVDAASRVPADSDVVVFLGGSADEDVTSLSVATAATQAFAAAAEQAPDAEIVVVGPLFVADGDAAANAELRGAIQSAARIAEIRWVDPVRAEWLPDVESTTALTPAAERTIATRIASLLESVLD